MSKEGSFFLCRFRQSKHSSPYLKDHFNVTSPKTEYCLKLYILRREFPSKKKDINRNNMKTEVVVVVMFVVLVVVVVVILVLVTVVVVVVVIVVVVVVAVVKW